MTTELLPKVELWQLSQPAVRTLEEILRRVLAETAHAPPSYTRRHFLILDRMRRKSVGFGS
jgi:hypothetical protein